MVGVESEGGRAVAATETRVLRVAGEQHGVVRRDQVLAEGLTRRQLQRRLDQERLVKTHPGVYRCEGAPQTWLQRLQATALWARRDYAFSHRTAAALWGLARFEEGCVELVLARNARPPPGVIVHRVRALPHHDVREARDFRVTSLKRTLLDLAEVAPSEDVRAALDQALARRRLALDDFAQALSRRTRRPGLAFLRELVGRYQGGEGPTESELEARVLELLEAAGVRAECQRRVEVAGRLRRLDFRIPGTPVIIEADGYAFHAGLQSFEKDRERNNALIARGFRVLHWTWAAIHERPEELLRELHRTLGVLAPALTSPGRTRPGAPSR
ncbi:MAG: type IV toxin-antitoxin system AbiEi family antitoxin domain-containing protein [Myxococcota bacterium]